MADSSLDDFFAKKDKSKKKNKKTKFTAEDILAKQKEEPKKPDFDKRDDKPQQLENDNKPPEKSLMQKRKEQDEQWVDFEDEKDYSGLRIQNLQLGENEQDREDNGQGEENEDEGDENDGASGPWMKVNAPAKSAEAPPPPVEEKKVEPKPAGPAEPKKYVPPSLRNQTATAAVPARRRGWKKSAPNLTSEEDFPTLGGASMADSNFDDGTGRFEKVRSGGRQQGDAQQGIKLELGNKFDALQAGMD